MFQRVQHYESNPIFSRKITVSPLLDYVKIQRCQLNLYFSWDQSNIAIHGMFAIFIALYPIVWPRPIMVPEISSHVDGYAIEDVPKL